MARALIVACGCRGRGLGAELLEQGWAVRGTSRREAGLGPIEAAGIEPALADPSRPGTILELVGDVAVVLWLLGSARGGGDELAALHGPPLEHLLERLVDTPVRGFVYEAAGSVPATQLEAGAGAVSKAGRTWRIPVALLEADPEDRPAWAGAGLAATLGILRPAADSI